jgi:hypothetical protein
VYYVCIDNNDIKKTIKTNVDEFIHSLHTNGMIKGNIRISFFEKKNGWFKYTNIIWEEWTIPITIENTIYTDEMEILDNNKIVKTKLNDLIIMIIHNVSCRNQYIPLSNDPSIVYTFSISHT